MEDLSVLIKKSMFEDMYKKKTESFRTIQERVEKANVERKNNRRKMIFENRKIPADMSPFLSPGATKVAKKTEKVVENQPKKTDNPDGNKRLEMLAKWKAEKEKKKLEQKKSQKPLFKVSHIPLNVGLPNLETVNKEIKGKPIKSKFAPHNHKFKPPPNIKPINFTHAEPSIRVNNSSRMITRSQSRTGSTLPQPSLGKGKENLGKTPSVIESKPLKTEDKKAVPKTKKMLMSEKPKANIIDRKKETNPPLLQRKASKSEDKKDESTVEKPKTPQCTIISKTPEKTESLVYVSPFVTLSRGKNSARKEYEMRKSNKSFSSNTSTSPKAGATYFTCRLDNQINRLQSLCDQWNKYKEQEKSPPEEAISMIDVVIGQTNLLITKKFVQFRGLINRCKVGDREAPVTCEDLHGFWDMIHIQIDNLDKRFENLQKMKENNWQEVLPEVSKGAVKKRGRPPKVAKASSGLREAIKAARMKKQNENSESLNRKTPQKRISNILNDVKSSEVQHRNSSPGLMMMKVAQYAKGVNTPMKSILKNDAQKSAKSHSKSVLFQDGDSKEIGNIENDSNVPNSQRKTPTRRSERLSKVKLF